MTRRQPVEGLPFHEPTLAAARTVAQGASLLAALIGAVGLSGWILGVDVLKSALPGGVPAMKPNTAVALLSLGLSLFVVVRGSAAPKVMAGARAAAVLATSIGGLTLAEHVTGAGLGIDQLVFRDDTVLAATGAPGRTAPSAAAALTIAGVAALCMSMRRLPAWTSQVPGLAVLCLGLLRLYGLAYDAPELERFGAYMALPTALALVLLGAAAFLGRPDEGPAGLLMNAGTMGPLGRRLVVANLVVPLLLGWAVLAGQDAGLYGGRLGTALLVWGHATVFTGLVFVTLPVGRRVELAHARAEWQVRQNELLLAFMDHTPAMVFITDLDGRFLAVNARFEESTGLPYERIVEQRAPDLLPPALARHLGADDLATLARGSAVQREGRLLLPGGCRDVLTTLFPLTDPADRPYAACGVVIDITERVAAQREVQRAHRRFHALLESAPDATLITDGDGIIVMANAQVKGLFGRKPDDLVGTSVVDLVPGPRHRWHSALLNTYLRRRDGRPIVLDRGLYGLHGDGGEFPVEVSISTLQAEQETLVFLTVRDITERRQAEADRAQRYEHQRRIAYTLQHSLMGEPPHLPHLPSAHRYLASVQDPGVGGDWFDIIPLDAGRTGIVIGDVMGRGLEAAAVMGQLRAASHALARTGITPSRLMTGLDAFVGDLADQLVTCTYLVVDQDAREVTLCSAGHMPVIALTPDGPAHRLRAPVGVPLGVNGLSGTAVPFQETTRSLPSGSTLALYTDGLVERPGADIDARIDILAHTLDGALKDDPGEPGALDEAASLLIGTLIPDTTLHDDDVTLLLVGLPASATAA
ncbi:SpoIIE family protein phosphatase [Streptomyces cyanogenus]|uniref:Sensor protein FixL n=1 Tax=Streptomyces cyanogenus TaxID=80860 RepID=A0ABX7U489_STRCY|nr:SpoIIE family protein phosphatase [Streptomyces cyanogenus]QTE02724.1 Sensor protein FixL [Streptomyces cyanogenus]